MAILQRLLAPHSLFRAVTRVNVRIFLVQMVNLRGVVVD